MTARPCGLVVDGSAALVEDADAGLAVVPVHITLGDAEFVDHGEQETYASFYAQLRTGVAAHTSTPAPGEYLAAFERLDADSIVCLTMPARWSGMRDSASLAASMLAERDGAPEVHVIEVQSAAVGLALTARLAALLCSRGQPAETVVAQTRRAGSEVSMYGSLATLTYVARSGRVPALVAGISNTLHIRPVFCMQGVETGRVALARTTSGALDALQRVATERLDGVPHWALVFHADAEAEARELAQRLSASAMLPRAETVALSPIAGAYTGPGAFGFAAMPSPDGAPPAQ